ncbi:smoothelin isoform 2-T2 [Discoglossus pictus]
MSEDRFSAMDEGSLRKLLEVTLDLAERREIRSAIRELRKKELERCEEALASKRFRSERSNEQEDKENQPGAEREEKQQKTLNTLATRLQDISDVEELTSLLRAASEYEERKLIRAAIRKLRNDEIEAASLGVMLDNYSRDKENGTLLAKGQDLMLLAQEREDLEERQSIKAQIQELRSAQNRGSHPAVEQDSSSDMLLLLNNTPREQPSSSSSSSTSERADVADSQATEHSCLSTDSELEDRSQKCMSEAYIEQLSQSSESENEKPSKNCAQEPLQRQDSRADRAPTPEWDGTTTSATSTTLGPDNKGSLPERMASRTLTEPDAQVPLAPFRRANSVRDRVKRFTEEPPSAPSSLGPRFSSMRGERFPARGDRLQQQQALFSTGQLNGKSAQAVKPGLACTVTGPSNQKVQQIANKIQTFKTPSIPELKNSRSASIKGSQVQGSAGLCTSSGDVSKRLQQRQGSFISKQEGGRSHTDKLQGPQPITAGGRQVENTDGTITASEKQVSLQPSTTPLSTSTTRGETHDADMKTLFTIEIKDGRNPATSSRVVGQSGNQRAELTLGLAASPFKIGSTTSSGISSSGISSRVSTISTNSNVRKVESEISQLPAQKVDVFLPSSAEKVEPESKSKLTAQELSAIEEEDVLDKLLDKTTDFEERRMIRTAMRELRQRKREQREKEREQRMQELKNKERETRLARSTEANNHGSAISTITKTQRLVQTNDGSKTSRTTTVEASYMKRSENGGTIVQTKSSFSATSQKVGSIFDREDDGQSKAAMERRQAERKKELMKAQSLPKTPATQARKAMIEKLEKESGSTGSPAFAKVATPQSSSAFGVPNANSIKQMLLDWCKAKTRGYEHVNIQNFSSSWSDGMAFCALVHNFFPEAFDYNQLMPQNRRQNFDLAFSAAEKHADCPQLLDAEDMVRMREPDWKCVYTYIQEFYRCLVQKGMVKTKKS